MALASLGWGLPTPMGPGALFKLSPGPSAPVWHGGELVSSPAVPVEYLALDLHLYLWADVLAWPVPLVLLGHAWS